MKRLTYINYRGELSVHRTRGLPHWDIEDGIYFLTWRLADSLPRGVVEELRRSYDRAVAPLRKVRDARLRQRLLDEARRGFFRRELDPFLDEGRGERYLERDGFAECVQNSLLYFNGVRYLIVAWAILGNHVHVVFLRHPDHALDKVVGAWKSFTSHQLKPQTQLGPDDAFWAAGYWDRLVRTEEELRNTIEYVLENPANAGMKDWPWVGHHADALAAPWPDVA